MCSRQLSNILRKFLHALSLSFFTCKMVIHSIPQRVLCGLSKWSTEHSVWHLVAPRPAPTPHRKVSLFPPPLPQSLQIIQVRPKYRTPEKPHVSSCSFWVITGIFPSGLETQALRAKARCSPPPHCQRCCLEQPHLAIPTILPCFCPDSKPHSKSSPKTVLEKSFPTQAWDCYRRSPITMATLFINIQEGMKKKLSHSELVSLVQKQHPFLKQGT